MDGDRGVVINCENFDKIILPIKFYPHVLKNNKECGMVMKPPVPRARDEWASGHEIPAIARGGCGIHGTFP